MARTKVVASDVKFLHDYLHVKNLTYRLIPSRDFDNQQIMQYNWTRETTRHTHPKVIVSGATFP